jgi:hypothetical protein
MLSSLDSLSFHIKVQNILHSLGEARKIPTRASERATSGRLECVGRA